MSCASNGAAAAVPALMISGGLDATGQPEGVVLSGDFLSELQLLAVGYALKQALQGRVEPDLDTVIGSFLE